MFSLGLLHFGGCGALDLAEICQFSFSNRCAFDFRHPTFAYPPPNHTAGAPALRTWSLGLLDIMCVFAVFLRYVKISLCSLHFGGCGSLDLAEIYPFGLWTRCAFDFRHPTLAYPPPNHTAGAPALRTCNLGERPPCAHVTWASWISSLFSLGASLARVCFKPPALRYPTQFLKTLYRIATDVGLCSVHLRFLAPDVHRPPPVEGFPHEDYIFCFLYNPRIHPKITTGAAFQSPQPYQLSFSLTCNDGCFTPVLVAGPANHRA